MACFGFVTAQTVDVDTSSASSCAIITSNLRYLTRDANGSTNVFMLQDFLNSRGYLASAPTGFFGAMTRKAVIAFQNDNGLKAIPPGYVGVGTRAKIQELDCVTSSNNGSQSTTLSSQITLNQQNSTSTIGKTEVVSSPSVGNASKASKLTITQGPSYGTTYRVGDHINLKWSVSGFVSKYTKIYLYGNSVYKNASEITGPAVVSLFNDTAHEYVITLSSGIASGSEYRIVVCEEGMSSGPLCDNSQYFLISSEQAPLIAPSISYLSSTSYNTGLQTYGRITIYGSGFDDTSEVTYYQNGKNMGGTGSGPNLVASQDGKTLSLLPLQLADGVYQIKVRNNRFQGSIGVQSPESNAVTLTLYKNIVNTTSQIAPAPVTAPPLATLTMSVNSIASKTIMGGLANTGLGSIRFTPSSPLQIREIRFTSTGADAISSVLINGVSASFVGGVATIPNLGTWVSPTGTDLLVNVTYSGFQNSTTGGVLPGTSLVSTLTIASVTAVDQSGRTVTVTTPASFNPMTLTPGNSGSTPIDTLKVSITSLSSRHVIGGTLFSPGSVKVVTAQGSAATIKEMRFTSILTPDSIESVTVNGVTAPFISGVATLANLNLSVSNSDIPVMVKYSGFQNSTTGGSLTSGGLSGLTLTSVTAVDQSNRILLAAVPMGFNPMTLVASKPTVIISSNPGPALSLGSDTKVGEFTVSSDANGKISLVSAYISLVPGNITSPVFSSFRITDATGVTMPTGTVSMSSPTSVVVFFDSSYEILAGQSRTYGLYAKVDGTSAGSGVPYVTSSLTALAWKDVIGGNATRALDSTTLTGSYTTQR